MLKFHSRIRPLFSPLLSSGLTSCILLFKLSVVNVFSSLLFCFAIVWLLFGKNPLLCVHTHTHSVRLYHLRLVCPTEPNHWIIKNELASQNPVENIHFWKMPHMHKRVQVIKNSLFKIHTQPHTELRQLCLIKFIIVLLLFMMVMWLSG